METMEMGSIPCSTKRQLGRQMVSWAYKSPAVSHKAILPDHTRISPLSPRALYT